MIMMKMTNVVNSPPIIKPFQNSLISITTHHNTNSNQTKHNYQRSNNHTTNEHYFSHLNTPSQKPQKPPTRISCPVWSPGCPRPLGPYPVSPNSLMLASTI